jgi:hypothetical protein
MCAGMTGTGDRPYPKVFEYRFSSVSLEGGHRDWRYDSIFKFFAVDAMSGLVLPLRPQPENGLGQVDGDHEPTEARANGPPVDAAEPAGGQTPWLASFR